MGNFTVKKKSVNQVEYQGKTYTCNGERIVMDGQSRWLYRTKRGLDLDILICDDRYADEPEFTHLTKFPSGCYIVPVSPAVGFLTFTAEEANSTVTLTRLYGSDGGINLQYSLDKGDNWEEYSDGWKTVGPGETLTLESVGDTVMFKGENNHFTIDDGSGEAPAYRFVITGTVACSGDVTSLLNGTGGDYSLKTYSCCFYGLFRDCTGLTKAPNLPSTELSSNCYGNMFYGCTSLTSAPELPATTLTSNCYSGMFYGCTSLTSAPELPATTLASSCYRNMFNGCTSLTSAPELPATTLVNACYNSMFQGCTGLTSTPELPATKLETYCYSSMFNGCTSISNVTCLATDISANSCTYIWLSGVSGTGVFTKAQSMSNWTTGNNGIPSGWTVVDA